MLTQTLNFPIADGMQAKPASEITNYFRNFEGECYIQYKTFLANTKSIISLLGSGIPGGAEIEIQMDSPTAQADMEAFVSFLNTLG